jgi:hypothetical protein
MKNPRVGCDNNNLGVQDPHNQTLSKQMFTIFGLSDILGFEHQFSHHNGVVAR